MNNRKSFYKMNITKDIMKLDKRGNGASFGWAKLAAMLLAIAIGIILLILLVKQKDIGQSAWNKIKDINPFA